MSGTHMTTQQVRTTIDLHSNLAEFAAVLNVNPTNKNYHQETCKGKESK